MKKYTIECTEEQLLHIARCVEDCHRFATGDAQMHNTTANTGISKKVGEILQSAEYHITGGASYGSTFGWDGSGCKSEAQRKFIAQTYPIYREVYHFLAVTNNKQNVYASPTLTCPEGGTPIKIKMISTKQ